MKKFIVPFLILLFGFAGFAYALPYFQQTQSLLPAVNDTYNIGTTSPSTLEYNNIFTKNITVSGTCTGCSGAGGTNDWVTNGLWLTPTSTIGVIVNASSTIGNGTQKGGLTVSGGATTTGTSNFGGSLLPLVNGTPSLGSTFNGFSSLFLKDSASAFDVGLQVTNTGAAGSQSLTFDVGNYSPTLTFSGGAGNPTLGDWFNQNVKTTGTPTFAGLLSTASTTFSGNATTTGSFFAGTASSTKTFGASLSACTGTNFLQWSAGTFSCTASPAAGSDPFTHPAAGQSATTSLLLLYGQASTTIFSALGPAYFGQTGTSSFSNAGALTLITPLLVGSGGTGANTFTSGQVLYGSGTNAFGSVATGTVSAGSTAITVTAGRFALGGALAIDCATASASQVGCLGTSDFSSFTAKQAGGFQISTTTGIAVSGVAFVSSVTPTTFSSVATTSETCTAPLSCAAHAVLAGGGAITWTGISTSSTPVVSNLLTYTSTTGGVVNVATTTQTFSGPFSLSAAQGALVGGSNSTITWTGLATTSAGVVSNIPYFSTTSGLANVATSSTGTASTLLFLDSKAHTVITNASTTNETVATNLDIGGSNVRPQWHLGVAGIATTTAGTGTTTIDLATMPSAATITSMTCDVNGVGTWNVQLSYGPAITNLAMVTASSTHYKVTFSANNTPANNATTTIAFGTAASSPVFTPQCTLEGTWAASTP